MMSGDPLYLFLILVVGTVVLVRTLLVRQRRCERRRTSRSMPVGLCRPPVDDTWFRL